MTDASNRPAGTTRERLIAAAARQFAHRSYSTVSLDDILAEAQLTKGAMYFHFPSKQALATAIVDDLVGLSRSALAELVARRMSGLETLIEVVCLLAVQDAEQDVARAGLRLLESLEATSTSPTAVWESWVATFTALIHDAVAEGDVVDHHDADDIARMIVALWLGTRRISDTDHPAQFVENLRRAWVLALPSFTNPDRVDYFTQFINRRHALAVKNLS
jgi:AcrR family transcriptional regulator